MTALISASPGARFRAAVAAERPLQVFVRFLELFREARLHHSEADEKASKQQNFGGQEQPHTDLAGIELLLHGGEMVLMVGIAMPVLAARLVGMKIDDGSAHTWVTVRGR